MNGDFDVQIDEIVDGFTPEELAEWNDDIDDRADDALSRTLDLEWSDFWQQIREESVLEGNSYKG